MMLGPDNGDDGIHRLIQAAIRIDDNVVKLAGTFEFPLRGRDAQAQILGTV